MFPLVSFNVRLMVAFPPRTTPPFPFAVTLFAVKAGIAWLLVPLKLILPDVVANVPLLIIFPKRSNVPFVPIVSDPPVLIVMFLAVPATPVRLGIFAAPDGMITSVADVGIPPHQLDAVFQSVLVTPIQVCDGATVIVMSFDVAVDCVTHVNEVVITTVTTSSFTRAAF